MSSKEPTTREELQPLVDGIGVAVYQNDGGAFIAKPPNGSPMRLDAEDYTSALFEAWNLYKPD